MNQDLSNLKPGDPVILKGGSVIHGDRLVKVKKITATQIVVEGHPRRFRRENGIVIGGGTGFSGWYRIKIPSAEDIQKLEHKALAERLGCMNQADWLAFDLETLQAIKAILDGSKKE